MDCHRIGIHPMGTEAGAEIGEVIHELGGTLHEKPLLGMLHFEARFPSSEGAEKAIKILNDMDCVSLAEWVEYT